MDQRYTDRGYHSSSCTLPSAPGGGQAGPRACMWTVYQLYPALQEPKERKQMALMPTCFHVTGDTSVLSCRLSVWLSVPSSDSKIPGVFVCVDVRACVLACVC